MPTLQVKRTNPVVVWSAGLLIIVVLFFAVRWLTRERVEVRVATPTYQNLIKSVPTNGKVEPIVEFQAHAASPGQVAKLYVEVGDTVKPGALLVKMDDSDIQERIANAELSISSAQVGLDTIEHSAARPRPGRRRSRSPTDAL